MAPPTTGSHTCLETAPGVATYRLGLLAVALGSGAVQVLAVPHPGALPAASASGHATGSATGAGAPHAGAAPPVVELVPMAAAAPGSLGPVSLPSTIAWLPTEPHDRLVVRAQRIPFVKVGTRRAWGGPA